MTYIFLAVMTGGGPMLGLMGTATARTGPPPLTVAPNSAPYPPFYILLSSAEDAADEADALAREADALGREANDIADSCAEAVGESCIEINNRNDSRNVLRNVDTNASSALVPVTPTPAVPLNAARLAPGAMAGQGVSQAGDAAVGGALVSRARRAVGEAKRITGEARRVAGQARDIVGLAAGVDAKAEQVAADGAKVADGAERAALDAGKIAGDVVGVLEGRNGAGRNGQNSGNDNNSDNGDDGDDNGGGENESVGYDCGGGRSCRAGESLPFTGVPAATVIGVGGGLLAVGTALLMLARRRRSTGAK
ncbi:hypothetical protein GCM10022252_69150 [Streptosporangium oxazolinicum]|uniref:Gram-positive cocci surface proteins LPxTG domain-containing protein n=1 Tax=Streptosporangium oxazolinicum TaxID=909287 RepID=A0ABP8BH36_9ACTN